MTEIETARQRLKVCLCVCVCVWVFVNLPLRLTVSSLFLCLSTARSRDPASTLGHGASPGLDGQLLHLSSLPPAAIIITRNPNQYRASVSAFPPCRHPDWHRRIHNRLCRWSCLGLGQEGGRRRTHPLRPPSSRLGSRSGHGGRPGRQVSSHPYASAPLPFYPPKPPSVLDPRSPAVLPVADASTLLIWSWMPLLPSADARFI